MMNKLIIFDICAAICCGIMNKLIMIDVCAAIHCEMVSLMSAAICSGMDW